MDNEKGWRIRGIPCCFLCDNKCTVYEDRPQNCRDYPYLYEPQFSYRTIDMIERTYTCPIVFNAIEELKEELEFDDKYFETDWQQENISTFKLLISFSLIANLNNKLCAIKFIQKFKSLGTGH